MAGIIYEFMDGLREEIAFYDKLYNLADKKRGFIIKGDISKINEINKKEERLVMSLKGCERRRKQFMSDIAMIVNINSDTVTISQIEEALKNQPEESSELAKIKQALIKSLERLKVINDDNMTLINQSLDYAQFSINLLQSSMDGPSLTSNYGGEEEGRVKSFFDAKQ